MWLDALPVPSMGTNLDNESLRIALGLRLGVPIIVDHTCVTHSLSRRCSGGHIPQHAAMNETIHRALVLEVYLLLWS